MGEVSGVFTRQFFGAYAGNQGADVRIVKNHVSIQSSWGERRKPKIEVKIKVVFSLIDSSYFENLSTTEIEASVTDILEKQAKKALLVTQLNKSDIFGFGNRYRGELKSDEKWSDLYKSAQINIHIISKLRNHGLEQLKK